jgi:tetratricopeptide (TPR) repeat protein
VLSASRSRWIGIAVLLAAAGTPAGADEAGKLGAGHVREGNRLLAEGRFKEALAEYDKAGKALPGAAEVAYNRGVAFYRMGEYEQALKTFQDALHPDRPDLEAKTKFNLGRVAHEAAIAEREKLEAAVNHATRAVSFYQEALDLEPADAGAKANREAAERLLAYLQRKLKEQPQKKEPSSQPSSQPQDPPTSQPEEKPQTSQPSSQPSSQPQEQEGEQQDQPQEGDEESNGQKEKQEKKGDRGEQQKEGQEGKAESSGEDQEQQQAEEKEMREQDVEPMLQEARDAERDRREARRARMMRLRGRVPVKKDW